MTVYVRYLQGFTFMFDFQAGDNFLRVVLADAIRLRFQPLKDLDIGIVLEVLEHVFMIFVHQLSDHLREHL